MGQTDFGESVGVTDDKCWKNAKIKRIKYVQDVIWRVRKIWVGINV